MVARTTIKLCSDNGGQECYMFVATKEVIQHFVDGELTASFSAQVPVDMKYTSTLYLRYERGQEMYSTNSPLIDTFDIDKVNISSDCAGSACFNVTRIAGSLLYRTVVQFVDAISGSNITRVLVFDDAEIVCIDGLPSGGYSINVGKLDVPLQSTGQEVTIEADGTSKGVTSTGATSTASTITGDNATPSPS